MIAVSICGTAHSVTQSVPVTPRSSSIAAVSPEPVATSIVIQPEWLSGRTYTNTSGIYSLAVNGDYLSTWHCPECGAVSYLWHFTAQDGHSLTATLPSLPDLSALEAAKAKALAEHESRKSKWQ